MLDLKYNTGHAKRNTLGPHKELGLESACIDFSFVHPFLSGLEHRFQRQ